MELMTAYLRMVSYALVLCVSLVKLFKFNEKRVYVYADISISLGLFLSIFHPLFLGVDHEVAISMVLTPLVILWASLIFYNFLKK